MKLNCKATRPVHSTVYCVDPKGRQFDTNKATWILQEVVINLTNKRGAT